MKMENRANIKDNIKDVLITIPARSGSKRLPSKNTLRLRGKPMLYYTIKAVQEAEITDEIYVLSDSKKTLAIAKRYGAKTFLLPPELAGDTTGVVNASLHLIEELEKKNQHFLNLICLQPTSPLRSAEDIIRGYSIFQEKKADTLVSISEVDPHYFHWAMECPEISSEQDKLSTPRLFFGEKFLKPRQELTPIYFPNGAVKIAGINFLKQKKHFFGEKMAVHLMPQERSVHVATQVDFDFCSLLMKRREMLSEKQMIRKNEISEEKKQ